MKEELILFETAKLAKEKGFDLEVNRYYNKNGNEKFHEEESFGEEEFHFDAEDFEYDFNHDGKFKNCYSAPTQSLLQRWLREKHGVHVSVFSNEICWSYTLDNTPRDGSIIFSLSNSVGGKMCKTYEQALEEGLLEALKMIKL